ncbi:MAG: SCO family protein [Gemmatimonadales bacterium]
MSEVSAGRRESWGPVIGLGAILVVTAAWWALALWPAPNDPAWLARTREVCFNAGPDGLPGATGWLVLIGEPIGMLGVLLVVWGRPLVAGLSRMAGGWGGQTVLVATAALVVIGLAAAGARVAAAEGRGAAWLPDSLPGVAAVDRPAPPLALVDQHGRAVSLTQFAGRPVLLTFAFAHCTAICPAQVRGVLDARRASGAVAVVVTVDPWRDTPERLPSIAEGWGMAEDELMLSGSVDSVLATLERWRVRIERDSTTGDVGHPATVYLIGRSGRIVGLGLGTSRALAAAATALAR